MNDLINRLIGLDKEARTMVEDSENYRDSVLSNLEQEIEQFKKAYVEKAERRIGLVRDEENKVSGQAVQDAAARIQSLMESLNTSWQQHHKEWEDSLYERCIGR